MNERIGNNKIYLLAKEAGLIEFEQFPWNPALGSPTYESVAKARKFAELIVEEFRNVLADEYRKTPLECCGHFLRADETIAKHFYGVEE